MNRATIWIAFIVTSAVLHGSRPALGDTADGLFIAKTTEELGPSNAVRARAVSVRFDLIDALKPQEVNEVVLNLFDDTRITCFLDHVHAVGSTQVWSGSVEGSNAGHAMLAVNGDAVAIDLQTEEATYEVRPEAGVGHLVLKHGAQIGSFDPCGVEAHHGVASAVAADSDSAGAARGSLTELDVMVLYTPDALAAAGSVAGMESTIGLAVNQLNFALTSSAVDLEVNLVYCGEVPYTETASAGTDLSRLRDTSDGFMDEVHMLRDAYGADMVALIVENMNSYCGIAYRMATLSPNFEVSAFSVTKRSCAVGNRTFSHEIGHNLGCHHDRGSATSGPPIYPYSHGHIGGNWFTIMAIWNGNRILHFSNPDVEWSGQSTGTSLASGTPEHNALTIINTMTTAADFRSVPDCNGNAIPDIDEINGGATDCDGDLVLDECQLAAEDCDGNGQLDSCDLAGGSPDCNSNGIVDACDEDCDGNGEVDVCELAAGTLTDCNANTLPDPCDIANATSTDDNGNGNPDECDVTPILRVDASAAPGGDGSSWASAIDDLQTALAMAAAAPPVVEEIWVAGGTYRPAPGGGDRQISFAMQNTLAVYGGFSGTETDLEDRDPAANPTILNGDLNQDDLPDFVNRTDNVFNVVEAVNLDNTALLDGFVIESGHADGTEELTYRGGGLYSSGGLIVRNCLFRDNFGLYGGGAAVLNSELFESCTFEHNRGLYGGGVFEYSFNAAFRPQFVNCRFIANYAEDQGGGGFMPLAMVTNGLFIGNFADASGGGAISSWHTGTGSVAIFANCTITNNDTAGVGGGVMSDWWGVPFLQNSIVWGNTDSTGTVESGQFAAGPEHGGLANVNFTCIQGGWPETPGWDGVGIVDQDPSFVDPIGPDGLPATGDEDYAVALGSPCIDAGELLAVTTDAADLDEDGDTAELTPLDLMGHSRFVDDPWSPDVGLPDGVHAAVDLGAFEYQAVDCGLVGDVNADTKIDGEDISVFVDCLFGGAGGFCNCADVNQTGAIDVGDVAPFVALLLD